MSLATLLGAGQLMIIQAGVQSIIVDHPDPRSEPGLQPLAGRGGRLRAGPAGGHASRPAPRCASRPRLAAARSCSEMAATLEAAIDGAAGRGRVGGRCRCWTGPGAARAELAELDEAADEGLAVVRQSPFRRRQPARGAGVRRADRCRCDRASRNLRVLARRCVGRAVAAASRCPGNYSGLMAELAEVMRLHGERAVRRAAAASPRASGWSRSARPARTCRLPHSISAVVILAQCARSLADLLELTGMDYAEARELIPEMD